MVLTSDTPVVVDFWAEWCGPCKMIAPILEELASENSETFKVGKVNVDDNRQTAMQYGVRSIPTLLVSQGRKSCRADCRCDAQRCTQEENLRRPVSPTLGMEGWKIPDSHLPSTPSIF